MTNKKFCFCLTARTGCYLTAITMIILSCVFIIVIAIDAVRIKRQVDIHVGVWKTAYSYILATIFFCCFICLLNLWYIYGIYYKKSSVILSCAIAQKIFLLYIFCGLLVLIILYEPQFTLTTYIILIAFFLLFMVSLIIFLVCTAVDFFFGDVQAFVFHLTQRKVNTKTRMVHACPRALLVYLACMGIEYWRELKANAFDEPRA